MVSIILLKKYIPKYLKIRIKSKLANRRLKNFLEQSKNPKIFLIGTPAHGNLGDQAIAYSEIAFLKDHCKNFDVFEIQFYDINYCLKQLMEEIAPNDVIMLQGGGNMGVEYLAEEELRRTIITNFNKQKIICFPQTIDFGDSDFGKKELEKTKKIYNSHSNLTLIAREKISFERMKDIFIQNNVILTPDIVMYLNENKLVEERNNILFCFRNDLEKVVSPEFTQRLYEQLSTHHNVIITDTVVNHPIAKEKREFELSKLWLSFRQSKLVITDRLHGMVFAAITSTPCIALSNYNHKVKGTYEWIQSLPYIRFIENDTDINKHIDELLALNNNEYDNTFSMDYYAKILKLINT